MSVLRFKRNQPHRPAVQLTDGNVGYAALSGPSLDSFPAFSFQKAAEASSLFVFVLFSNAGASSNPSD